ncbi:MAG: sigma-70 family RNA polymerase sigma factor [Gemmatimonadales bacterium]
MPVTQEDRAWFEGEVVSALPVLLAAALRLARNRTDAEDLVADAVARAWTGLPSLRERAAFRGWIFRILTNTFISDRRRRAEGPMPGDDREESSDEGLSLFERLHHPFLLWWGNPEQEFLNRLLREDVERAVDSLPEPFRVVVILADLQGLSYNEIAAALHVPLGTVRSRLARGRAALQKALWKHAQDAGLRGPLNDDSTAEAR